MTVFAVCTRSKEKKIMPAGKEDVAKFFDVNGYISPLDVLNREEVKELRAHFNQCEEEIGKIVCCC